MRKLDNGDIIVNCDKVQGPYDTYIADCAGLYIYDNKLYKGGNPTKISGALSVCLGELTEDDKKQVKQNYLWKYIK